MAIDNSTTLPASPALPEHCDVLNALLNLKGAIRLSREAVYTQMGTDDDLVAAEGVLELAESEIERIYAILESAAVAKAWPFVTEAVPHG